MFGQIKKELKFSFFETLRKLDVFSYLDEFFCFNLNPKNENEAIFLAYLFLVSKKGFISLEILKDSVYPDPRSLNIDNLVEIDESKFVEKIILGSSSFSENNQSIICKYNNFFYLQKNFVFETKIIENFQKLLSIKPANLFIKDKFQNLLENEKTLSLEQKKAIQSSFDNSISFILGGPGTGKTFAAAYLIDIFSQVFKSENQNLKIVATSFTGKATSHLKSNISNISNISKFSKNIPIDSKTLHSLLNIKEKRAKFFDKDKLIYDLILVDESSMLDLKLMAHLMDSIKAGARVIFIGDPNQLPPIDSGNVFAELSFLNIIPKVYLKIASRFENNKILQIANFINNKNVNGLIDIVEDIFYDLEKPKFSKKTILDMAKTNFSTTSKDDSIEDIFAKINNFKILSSIKKGYFGVDQINNEIFSMLFSKLEINDHLYVPIIITKNNYKLDLFNGQIGILKIQKTTSGALKKQIYFQTDNTIQSHPLYLINFYEYAYCISIHKSQGSEFKSTCIVMPEGSINFGKELFYTAVTRAKNEIYLFSTKKMLKDLINISSFKKSAISKRLK